MLIAGVFFSLTALFMILIAVGLLQNNQEFMKV